MSRSQHTFTHSLTFIGWFDSFGCTLLSFYGWVFLIGDTWYGSAVRSPRPRLHRPTHTHTHTNAQFSLYNFTIVAILRVGCFRCLVSTRWMNWGCWLQHFQHFRCLGNHQLGAGSCLFISTTVDYLLTDLMRWTYFNYLLLFVYVLFIFFWFVFFAIYSVGYGDDWWLWRRTLRKQIMFW